MKNLITHLLEDVFYQAKARASINSKLEEYGLNYFSLGNKTMEITRIIEDEIIGLYNKEILNSFKELKIDKASVFSLWNRMFEIGIDLELSNI